MSTSPSSRTAPHEIWRGIRQTVQTDTFGGILLLAATVAALVLANSPAASWYTGLRETSFGPEALHLHLTVAHWAADGLLAIFFFVVGLELKEEIVAGRLRSPRIAAVPVIGALGGVIVPALIFTAFTVTAPGDAVRGWAMVSDMVVLRAVWPVRGWRGGRCRMRHPGYGGTPMCPAVLLRTGADPGERETDLVTWCASPTVSVTRGSRSRDGGGVAGDPAGTGADQAHIRQRMTDMVGIIVPTVPTAPAEEHASERTRVDTVAVM